MVTESSTTEGNFEMFGKDPDVSHFEHQHQWNGRTFVDRSRELNIHRSGSAPPTVEGSIGAIRGLIGNRDLPMEGVDLLSEEAIRSYPAYLDYHYSTENLNPRLSPPVLSREDWRTTQRFQSRASPVGDSRKGEVGVGDVNSSSMFSLQPGVSLHDREKRLDTGIPWIPAQQVPVESGNNGLTGSKSVELGARRKSFADALQEELIQLTAVPAHLSHLAKYNAFGNFVDPLGIADNEIRRFQDLQSVNSLHSGAASPGLVRMQSFSSLPSHSLASGLGSSSVRSMTPDPQLIRRSPSPCLPPIGARGNTVSKADDSYMGNHGDVTVAFSGLNISKISPIGGETHVEDMLHQVFSGHSDFMFNLPHNENQYLQQNINNGSEIRPLNNVSMTTIERDDFSKKNGFLADQKVTKSYANGQDCLSNFFSSDDSSMRVPSAGTTGFEDFSIHYNNTELPKIGLVGGNMKSYSVNQGLPNMINCQLDSGGIDEQYLYRRENQSVHGFQVPLVDPLYAHSSRRINLAAQSGLNLNDPILGKNYPDFLSLDLPASQKAHLGALLAQQKLQHGMPFSGKSTDLHGYHGNASYGLGLPYSTNMLANSILSSPNPGNPLRFVERLSHFPTLMKKSPGGSLGSWPPENGIKEVAFGSSFLEEFKNNKNRSFELSEILGHVVEFSADQYGSRFIQQKLETASVEEKNEIFPEIFPHARALMTDVFGNYVIQKFFEHGTKNQRTQLANQLTGHVLALSLQMYGCRVIQKALEVVDVDQQTQMVSELDGLVIKCVRDQNGNHVIQKCIECVPQEKIQFIISTFYGQVVALSTHPYGCRVIQRVLEHCNDVKTQSIMMNEILQSVSTLALDQYGNYVVQHVLQHGRQEERTAIISTLAGQIVKMSQQKFASNVVEKCLTFGSQEERQLLINEILGSTDENEPLQAMMKDQFGNYVVQKVLEICDDQNRELILSRVKIHLNALKKYTYGKHIVARVEKLITTGERCIGISSYS